MSSTNQIKKSSANRKFSVKPNSLYEWSKMEHPTLSKLVVTLFDTPSTEARLYKIAKNFCDKNYTTVQDPETRDWEVHGAMTFESIISKDECREVAELEALDCFLQSNYCNGTETYTVLAEGYDDATAADCYVRSVRRMLTDEILVLIGYPVSDINGDMNKVLESKDDHELSELLGIGDKDVCSKPLDYVAAVASARIEKAMERFMNRFDKKQVESKLNLKNFMLFEKGFCPYFDKVTPLLIDAISKGVELNSDLLSKELDFWALTLRNELKEKANSQDGAFVRELIAWGCKYWGEVDEAYETYVLKDPREGLMSLREKNILATIFAIEAVFRESAACIAQEMLNEVPNDTDLTNEDFKELVKGKVINQSCF